MIDLSERLSIISGYIKDEEDIADIGTDHGYLPLYLLMKNPARKAVFTDVNNGPLTKAQNIIQKEIPDSDPADYDLRLGNGLEPLTFGEVDDIIIAGMGGILIKDILSKDIKKTRSFKKLILQPRTAADKLRKWLAEQNLYIYDEDLACENGRICEIIAVSPVISKVNDEFEEELDYEFSPILTKKKSKIVREWLIKQLETEYKIKESIEKAGNLESREKLAEVGNRIDKVEKIISDLY